MMIDSFNEAFLDKKLTLQLIYLVRAKAVIYIPLISRF